MNAKNMIKEKQSTVKKRSTVNKTAQPFNLSRILFFKTVREKLIPDLWTKN